MAVALSEADYEIYAIGRSEVALDELRAARPGITPLAVDVTDREAIEAIVTDLHIDVLINNAGMMPPLGNFADMKISDIDATLEVNLSAAIMLTRLVVPQMRDRGAGHILFTGSSAAHAAFPNMAVYSAAKAAIGGFAASLRADLSQVRHPCDGDRAGPGRDPALQGHSRRRVPVPPCTPEMSRSSRRTSPEWSWPFSAFLHGPTSPASTLCQRDRPPRSAVEDET